MATLSTLNVRVLGNTAGLNKSLRQAPRAVSARFRKTLRGRLWAPPREGCYAGLGHCGRLCTRRVRGQRPSRALLTPATRFTRWPRSTGFGTEALSELKFAAEQSGASLESVEKASKRMASTIFDAEMGLIGAEDALAALGLTAEDLKGLSPETQFQTIADKLGAVEDASTKAAIAQDIFGRSGAELIPLMNEGAEGMAALRQEARDLGVVFSQDAANSAADFKDAQNELKSAVNGLFFAVGSELTPAITAFTRFLVGNLPAIRSGIGTLSDGVKGFIETARALTKTVNSAFTARIEKVKAPGSGLLTADVFDSVSARPCWPLSSFSKSLAETVLSGASMAIKNTADALLPLALAIRPYPGQL